jgi:mannose-6-phosphate isomerase-like protein (cupin superfamily)
MKQLLTDVMAVSLNSSRSKTEVMRELVEAARNRGYEVVDTDMEKPWGAFVRFNTKDANDFIENFFPGLDPDKARLGVASLELSPKFLLVTPGARLSWQRHGRRAERWSYVTGGAYYKSMYPNDPGVVVVAKAGETVQFKQGECHRLVGVPGEQYTLVAEIWQHTDPLHPSDESDIERLQDDYKR